MSFSFPDGGAGWSGTSVSQGATADHSCDGSGAPSSSDCFVRILEASQGTIYNPLGKPINNLHAQGSSVITWSCVNKEKKIIDSGSGPVFTPQINDYGVYEVLASCKSTDGTSECTDHVTVVVFRVKIKSISFTSDHKVLQNTTRVDIDGPVIEAPHWKTGTPGVSKPITHTMGQKILMNVVVCVEPKDLIFELKGIGLGNLAKEPIDCINLRASNITSTGQDYTIQYLETGPLPAIVHKYDFLINWEISFEKDKPFTFEQTGPHIIYSILGSPQSDGEDKYSPTIGRMEYAVKLSEIRGPNPSEMVYYLYSRCKSYGSVDARGTIWKEPAENIFTNGECQAMVRLMKAVLEMIGTPGTFSTKVVYAKIENPEVPVVKNLHSSGDAEGDMESDNARSPEGYYLLLEDCSKDPGLPNWFEAILVYQPENSIEMLYYPGGIQNPQNIPPPNNQPAQPRFPTKNTVDFLHCFRSMAWFQRLLNGTFGLVPPYEAHRVHRYR